MRTLRSRLATAAAAAALAGGAMVGVAGPAQAVDCTFPSGGYSGGSGGANQGSIDPTTGTVTFPSGGATGGTATVTKPSCA